jgi:hypothetical protein
LQILDGSTLCNTHLLTSPVCARESYDSPQQYHRLDLRGASGLTHVRLTVLVDGLGLLPLLYVLPADASGGCGPALFCDYRINLGEGPPRASLMLDAQEYFVGIAGAEPGSAGAYRLLVEVEPGEPSPCVNVEINDCMTLNAEPPCCDDWSVACTDAVVMCGLARSTQDCVCSTNPDCCASRTADVDCSAARAACNYLCPEFAPSELGCLSAP